MGNHKARNSITYIMLLGLILSLASCGIQKRTFNDIPDISQELEADYLIQNDSLSNYNENKANVEWWSTYNDPVLDTLIQQAKTNNKDIYRAIANFYAARANTKGRKFDRFPTVTANGGFTRQRLGENVFAAGGNPTFNQYTATLDANWEIGLFGRVKNRILAAKSFEQAQLADMQDIYLSLFADLAATYIEYRGVQYQIAIAIRNIESQKEAYELTQERRISGTGNSLDEARSLALYESTRAFLPSLEGRLASLEIRMSVLIGEAPGTAATLLGAVKPLPSLPNSVSIGNVKQLLANRPDIFRAESLLSQQIAQYNLSVAELYPRISFNGNIGFSAINFDSFGQNEAFTWVIAPTISWAAFNLGRVKQQIDQQDALTLGLLANFEQTVLLALEDIQSSMALFTTQLIRRNALIKSVEASQDAAALARKRYDAGLDDFLDYLNAQQTLLQSENSLAVAETNASLALVSVYRALGSGWEIITPADTETIFNKMENNDATKN